MVVHAGSSALAHMMAEKVGLEGPGRFDGPGAQMAQKFIDKTANERRNKTARERLRRKKIQRDIERGEDPSASLNGVPLDDVSDKQGC